MNKNSNFIPTFPLISAACLLVFVNSLLAASTRLDFLSPFSLYSSRNSLNRRLNGFCVYYDSNMIHIIRLYIWGTEVAGRRRRIEIRILDDATKIPHQNYFNN